MTYRDDRSWSDRYLPAIRQLVGPHLLIPAPIELDTQQATDLIVLRARDMMIACRVRRHGYVDIYPFDITLRSKRDSGSRTELEKIVEGWGDWMFYGHAAATGDGIERWYLLDLHQWRREFVREGLRSALKKDAKYRGVIQPRSNGDGTHFVAFDVRRFPAALVIASSHPVPHIKNEAA